MSTLRRYEIVLTYKTVINEYTMNSVAVDMSVDERKAYTVASIEELDLILKKEPREITLLGQTLYLSEIRANGVKQNV
jgi:hypothetical protein